MIVADERVARFVADALGFALCPPWTAMGIERGGGVVAGVVFNCFEGAAVHVTAAGKGWTRGFLEAVGSYVFATLGCQRMTIVTEQSSVAALAVRLGAQAEGVMRDHFGHGRDGMVLGILPHEYRYGMTARQQRD